MMTILARYISKTIVAATGLAALIITSVLMLMLTLGEFKNMGEGDYGLSDAAYYVLLRLPNELYQFSPMLILLGSIIGLSILSSNREIAVMRASGFSTKKIIASVLMAALILIMCISIIGEWIGPNLSYRAEVNKETAQNAGQAVVTTAGIWLHVDDNFIHVQRVIGRQLAEGVTRYEFDNERRLQAAYYAKSLSFQQNQWRLHDVVKTSFYNERTKSQYFPQATWNLKFNPNLLNVGLVEPNEMSLPKLAKFVNYLEKNGLQANEYKFDFWQRIFKPLASLVMVFLAIPFVLGAMSASTMGWRILVGILVGFAFFILNAVLGQLSVVYQVPTILAALLPPLIFGIFGIFLSRRLIKN